jgi:hypothetical protein
MVTRIDKTLTRSHIQTDGNLYDFLSSAIHVSQLGKHAPGSRATPWPRCGAGAPLRQGGYSRRVSVAPVVCGSLKQTNR